MVGEPLAHAYLGPDGGYRDQTSAPPEGSGISFPKRVRVVQGRQIPQALGAHSVPGTEAALAAMWEGRAENRLRIGRYWSERALAAEAEVRALRAALSEALEAVR